MKLRTKINGKFYQHRDILNTYNKVADLDMYKRENRELKDAIKLLEKTIKSLEKQISSPKDGGT